ncbi:cell adhesion molecule DSCAM-like isoform X3 [Ornithodoros turicata]|uniref:cell adhesion molecule DSCAM-like isoform X3 n=1 Tax=Ornithodoros turicata TaxID=34597 RepID=UPI00313A3601
MEMYSVFSVLVPLLVVQAETVSGLQSETVKVWHLSPTYRVLLVTSCQEAGALHWRMYNRTWSPKCLQPHGSTLSFCLCLLRTSTPAFRTRRSLEGNSAEESGGNNLATVVSPNSSGTFAFSSVMNRRVRDVSSVTALKGKSVNLICPMYVTTWGSVSWEKGTSRIPFTHRQRVQPDGSLSIRDLQQATDDGDYVCKFTDARNQKHTGKVLLRVSAPPEISPFDFRGDMRVGMRFRVFCTATQGDPPFVFSWLKDGVTVDGPLARVLGLGVQSQRDFSMLSTDSLRLEHSGNYTCMVKNQAATATYSAVLRVNDPPKWKVEPEDVAVIQGRNVQLQCSATGTPPPSISWMVAADLNREEFLPIYNSHKYVVFPNGTLVINNVEQNESGYYLCKASNGYGEVLSKLIFITLKRPPKFDVKFRAHAVKGGEKARLQCTAVGDHPIVLSWAKNNERILDTSKYRISTLSNQTSAMTTSTLIVASDTVEDSGIYSCFAKNHYGSDETSMRLLVQEVPGSPANLTVTNATASSITLTWMEPFRGNSAITRFLVQYREAGTDDASALRNQTTDGTHNSTIILGLRPSRVISLRVKAENGVGWGPFSSWVTANTEEDSPASAPVNITARPTGPNSIKITWQPPKEEDWNGHLKGYYISYRPAGSNEQYYHKTIDVHNPHQRQELHLTNLRLSMSYAVAIQAFTSKGAGPRSEEFVVKTLDDVPPSPPTLEVMSVTADSVTLGWTLKTAFGNPVTEYMLYRRKDMEHWLETPISTVEPSYTVRELECGTTYQFYMTAHNSLGRSEPSDVIRIKTDGADIASVGATSSHSKKTSLSSVTDLEILIPVLVSSFVVVVVIIVGFILCSRESLCTTNRQGAPAEYQWNYPEEILAMKDMPNGSECTPEEGIRRSGSHAGSPYTASQSIYEQRAEIDDGRHPYAMPYDIRHSNSSQACGCEDQANSSTLNRRADQKLHGSNIYISRQSLSHQKQRERPYEPLTVKLNAYEPNGITPLPSRKDHVDVDA